MLAEVDVIVLCKKSVEANNSESSDTQVTHREGFAEGTPGRTRTEEEGQIYYE